MSAVELHHFDALKARLAPAGVLYERGKVPGVDGLSGSQPSEYLILDLSRVGGIGQRANGGTGRTRWRAVVRVAAMSSGNARALMGEANDLVDGRSLTVAGRTSTEWEFESGRPVTKAGSRFEGSWTWTYVL